MLGRQITGCARARAYCSTWDNCTVARGNEIDEQIGVAQRSVSAISPIALWIELKCSVVSPLRAAYTILEINDEWRYRRRASMNFSDLYSRHIASFNYRWIFQATRAARGGVSLRAPIIQFSDVYSRRYPFSPILLLTNFSNFTRGTYAFVRLLIFQKIFYLAAR